MPTARRGPQVRRRAYEVPWNSIEGWATQGSPGIRERSLIPSWSHPRPPVRRVTYRQDTAKGDPAFSDHAACRGVALQDAVANREGAADKVHGLGFRFPGPGLYAARRTAIATRDPDDLKAADPIRPTGHLEIVKLPRGEQGRMAYVE